MKTITFGKHGYTLPSTWDELTTQQLETLSKITQQPVTMPELSVKCTFAFMGMKVVKMLDYGCFKVTKGLWRRYLVSSFQVNYLIDCLKFLFKDNEIISERVVNPYPELRLGWFGGKRFFGPDSGLANITLSEWMQAEIERTLYEETQNPMHLFTFLAILWRPTGLNHPDGDMRAPLSQDTLTERAQYFSRNLHPYKIRVMQWYYYGCFNFITNKFDEVFSAGNSTEDTLFDSFMAMVNGLAKNDLSKIDKIRSSLLYEALYNLQILMKTQPNNKSNEPAEV
jgi:hypothetical protein